MRKIYSAFIIIGLLFIIMPAWSENLRFDPKLMSANGITSTLLEDIFNQHVIPVEDTKVNVYINGRYISSGDVFSVDGKPIYSEFLKIKLGIKDSVWSIYNERGVGKYFYLSEKIRNRFDREDNSLRLRVPSEYLINPEGIPKNNGGTGTFVNYNTYAYRFSGGAGPLESLYTEYEVGLNINDILVRSHGTYNRFHSRNYSTSVNSVRDGYFERDFSSLKLRMGRTIVSDGGFGTGYIDGAVVSSVNGNTTAFVNFSYDAAEVLSIEFWQNNLLLWKQIIQKGHSVLRNIPVLGYTGDVMVLIKRNEQIIDSRVISRGQITSVRDGNTGYYAFMGRAGSDRRSTVSGASLTKTLSSSIAPSIAIISASHYRGVTASNTIFNGDFRSTAWLTTVQNEKSQKGLSLNISSSYQDTSLSYSHNSRYFSYIGQALLDGYNTQHRNIGITQTQSFVAGIIGSLSLTNYRFYGAPSYNSISASMSLPINQASVSAVFSYMSLAPGRSEKDKISINLSLNVPLSFSNQRASWRSQYYQYGDRSRFSNSLSAPVTDSYAITASHMLTTGPTRSMTYMLDNAFSTPYTTANLSFSQEREVGAVSQTTAGSLSGAVAISKEGIIFSPTPIGDTWAVINTGVQRYLKVTSLQSSTVTNHDGKAIISRVAEARGDFIRISPDGLPPGMIIKNNVREFSAERGSVSFFNFSVVKNRSVLMRWIQEPAWVNQSDLFYSASGKLIARFIDKGILLVNEEDINKLKIEGMSSPAQLNIKCRLSTNRLNKQESINHVIFKCNDS